MAISDYLMTRLAGIQNARQLALQLEQAKAAREAAAQGANTRYIQQLLGAGTNLVTTVPGVISDIAAQQGQTGIQEAVTGLTAGEYADEEAAAAAIAGGTPSATAAAAPTVQPEAQVPAAVKAAEKLYTKADIGKRLLSGPEEYEQALEDMGFTPSTNQQIVDADAQRRGYANEADERKKLHDIDMAEYVKKAEAAARQGIVPRGIPSQDVEGQFRDIQRKFPEGVVPRGTPSQDVEGQFRDIQRGGAKNLSVTPGTSITGEMGAVTPLKKQLSPEDIANIKATGVAGTVEKLGVPLPALSPEEVQIKQMKPAEAVPERAETVAPAAPVPPAKQAEVKTPAEQELEKKVGKGVADIKDPVAAATEQINKRIREYKPRKFKQSEKDVADQIVEDVWKNQPQGNPILNILSFGQYNNKLDAAKRLAKKMVASEIQGLRKQAAAEDRRRFVEDIKLEAQNLAILQKDINEQRKAQLRVSMTSVNPQEMVKKLAGFQEADSMLSDVINAGKEVIASGQQFGGGADNAIALAKSLAIAATPSNQQVGTDLSKFGASAGIQIGPQMTKDDVFAQAIASLNTAELSPQAKEFNQKLISTIQQLGKAREGGKLTNEDLKFYLDNLVIQSGKNPSEMLKSINYLKMSNARSQNMWNKTYNALFGETMPEGMLFADLTPDGFSIEDFTAADKLGWMKYSPQVQTLLSRPGRVPSIPAAAGQVGSAVEQAGAAIKKRLGLTGPSASDAP